MTIWAVPCNCSSKKQEVRQKGFLTRLRLNANPERCVAVEAIEVLWFGLGLLEQVRDGNNFFKNKVIFLNAKGESRAARQTWVAIVDHLLGVAGVFVLREVGGGM
jgi:hypothetical protein